MALSRTVPAAVIFTVALFCIDANSLSCPEKNGRYPVSGECDAYIECVDGNPKRKLCPDGLLFDDKENPFSNPCKYPYKVDCGTRTRTQPAIPSGNCPRQNGYFKLGDRAHCRRFIICDSGVGHVMKCAYGLAFNRATNQCDWPDQVEDCDEVAYLGFSCPPNSEGQFYRDRKNCRKYFFCVNDRPRAGLCGPGEAFNEQIIECDALKNVAGCAN